jgi:hypothetical protein
MIAKGDRVYISGHGWGVPAKFAGTRGTVVRVGRTTVHVEPDSEPGRVIRGRFELVRVEVRALDEAIVRGLEEDADADRELVRDWDETLPSLGDAESDLRNPGPAT